MSRSTLLLSIFFLLSHTVPCLAADSAEARVTPQEGQPQSEVLELTLEKSIEIALENNLQIRIATLSRDALEPEIRRARAIFHPTVGLALTASADKTVDVTAPASRVSTQTATAFISEELPTGGTVVLSGDLIREDPEAGSREFGSAVTVSLVQPLLRGGRVFVATRPIRDAEFDVRIEEARLKADILKITAQAKTAYFNMILAENVITVTEAAIQRDGALVEASEALLRAELVTVRDVISAGVSLAQDKERLIRAQADLESNENALLDVLGLPIATDVIVVDADVAFEPIPLDQEMWIEVAIQNRPEIVELEVDTAKSELKVRVLRNDVLPRLDLVASYARSETASSFGKAFSLDGEEWVVGGVFSIPIGNVAAKAAVSRAEIEHTRLKTELMETRRQIELEVRAAVIKLQNSLARIEALEVVRDQSRRLEEVAKAQFTLGRVTNRDITDAQADLLDADTDLLGAIIDYNVALAELEAAIASSI